MLYSHPFYAVQQINMLVTEMRHFDTLNINRISEVKDFRWEFDCRIFDAFTCLGSDVFIGCVWYEGVFFCWYISSHVYPSTYIYICCCVDIGWLMDWMNDIRIDVEHKSELYIEICVLLGFVEYIYIPTWELDAMVNKIVNLIFLRVILSYECMLNVESCIISVIFFFPIHAAAPNIECFFFCFRDLF